MLLSLFMTPEQTQAELQAMLIQLSEVVAAFRKQHPELLDLASFHVAPDGAWISLEHEVDIINHMEMNQQTQIIRLSPACSTIVAKI
jgi:hypothetical protein